MPDHNIGGVCGVNCLRPFKHCTPGFEPTPRIDLSVFVLSNTYRLLVGKSAGKRPVRRPRRRWVDNIKMDLVQIESGGVDWISLEQDRDS
jgi:hypothetical protein